MKIYFNSSFQETTRVNDDLFVKGNTGNMLEAYFDDVDLKQTNINIRLVIKWADGTSTKELPMNKSFNRKYVYINLPTLLESGEASFTLRIYDDDNVVDGKSTLLQTAIFTRKILASVDESDKTSITNDEYLTLLKAIENLNNAQEIILTNVDAKPTLMTKEELDILSEVTWQAKLTEAIEQLEQLADNNLFEITGLEGFDLEEYRETINSIKADISSLKLQFYDYYTKGEIQAIVSTINSNIAAINTRIDNIGTSGGESITVDSELNSTSTNPVQNKAIFNKFGLLGNTITSNTENITVNTSDITKLKSKVATAESNITSMDARVTVLENSGGGGSEGGGSITVDDELSSTSTNPVQNKVIAAKITALENADGDIRTSIVNTNTVYNNQFVSIKGRLDVLEETLENSGGGGSEGGGSITVDDELSSTSTNPVQNKIIYEKIYKPHNTLEQTVSSLSRTVGNILKGELTSEEKSLLLKEAFNHQFPLGLVKSYLQFKSDTWDSTLFSKIEDNYQWDVSFWDAQGDSKFIGIRFNVGGTKGKTAFINESEEIVEVYTLDAEGWRSDKYKTIKITSGDATVDDVAWDYWFNDNIYQLFNVLLVNKSVELFNGSSTSISNLTLNSRGGTLIVRGKATASPNNYDTFTMTFPIIVGETLYYYIDIPFSTEYPSSLIHGYVNVGFDFDTAANSVCRIGTSNITLLQVYQVVS